MQCKKCGRENVDNAVFCAQCGSRVDGKILCKKCGELNENDNVFCIFCGTRIDGKKVCESCGALHEGNFCTACGKPSGTAKAGVDYKSVQKKKEGNGSWTRILQLASGGMMMLGVLLALIFVFFIGVTEVMELEGASASIVGGKTKTNTNLFYFFGDYYKDMDEAIKLLKETATPWFVDLIETQGTVAGVIGTVLVALTLVGVVAFAAVAIVKYALSWWKKREDTSYRWALATVLCYLAATALFYALNASHVEMEGVETDTRLSGATITGVVLIGVFVGLGILLRVCSQGKELLKPKKLFIVGCSLVGLAFACVLLALAKNVSFGFEMEALGVDVDANCGYLSMNVLLDAEFAAMYTDKTLLAYSDITAQLALINIYNVLAQLFGLIFGVFAAISLASQVRGLDGKKNKSMGWSICTAVSSVCVLVFTILSWRGFTDLIGLVSGDTMDVASLLLDGEFGVAVCCVVFSVLLIAVCAVCSVFVKKAVEEDIE